MVKVIGVGDCMVDKNLTTGMMYPGGQALNIAVNTKLCGAQSAFIGAFGDDYIADHMKKTMDEIGIDYSHSHFYHAPGTRSSITTGCSSVLPTAGTIRCRAQSAGCWLMKAFLRRILHISKALM